MKKQPKQGILRKTVNEGRYTINARTGERLHPKTGEPLPAKEKPITMKQMFAQKPAAKKPAGLSLDQIWRKVEDVVSSVYPDGDPIDHLAPWLEKQGIKGHQVGDVLRKAAVKNGYSDVYDYFNSMGDLSEEPDDRDFSDRMLDKLSGAAEKFSDTSIARKFDGMMNGFADKLSDIANGSRKNKLERNKKDNLPESYDEYEDDEQQDEGFFVVIGDEEDYSVFIGMLVKEDGKWRERTYSGNPPTNWGGTYMGYLTPQDVMSWLQKDYGRNYQVDGPFDSEEEANQHADMLREAAPSIKPREVNPDTRANILSRRKALQAIIMDPDTARDPALRREVARKKAELARMEREAGMVSEDQGGAVEAYGYAYNRKDQRVTWRRVFKSAEAAQAWAAKRNATVLGTRPVDGNQQGISEGPNDGKEDNFTIDDIKNLEQIQDLETLKARAKELIKGKPARRMKPEKISWFYNHIDNLKRPLDVIKMMYDLLLAGEGNKVIGTRHTMANNSYRQRFGEQSVEEGIMNTIANKVMGAAPEQPKYKVGQRVKYETSPHQPDWKDGGRGVGVITAYKNGHYMINGNPVNHFEIKGVVDEGVAEGKGKTQKYEMMMRNGQVKKFVAKDDAEAKRIAKGNGAKSVIRLKGGVPAGKVSEQGVAEGNFNKTPSGDYVNMHTGVRSSSAPIQKKVRGYKWHVNFDYGPHMTDTVVVSAASESEAIAKAEKAAEKKGLNIMVNWAKPHYRVDQGVAEATGNPGMPHDFTAVQPGAEVWYKGRFAGWTTGKVYDDPYGKDGKLVMFEPNPSEFPGDEGRVLALPYDEVSLRKSTSIGKLKGPGQGVAEGFGDVVKGIKRKVAGKEDPKEVEHMYGRIARSAIKHKTPDQAEKDIGRYKKVAKVVNKKG